MSNDEIVFKILWFVCLLFSLSVHEAAHAAIASRCGDPTGRLLGRVTLNPIPHIDPIGTLVMPLIMIFTNVPFLFGWAKPVPFNPRNLRHPQRDPVLIAIAGPLSNLLLALLTIFILRIAFLFFGVEAVYDSLFFKLADTMMILNFILLLFNLIPVPPLDGGHVLYYFLPESGQRFLDQIGPFGILFAIFVGSRFIEKPLTLLAQMADRLLFLGIPIQ
ncbi:MAG: site-2 protease family protein [Candidatus Hydrogenedentes bacterium]|nr:site-2 protease family protein [Candidatus Hydrogenedentota bacterium]